MLNQGLNHGRMGVRCLLRTAIPADIRLNDNVIAILDKFTHASQRFKDLTNQPVIIAPLADRKQWLWNIRSKSSRNDIERRGSHGCSSRPEHDISNELSPVHNALLDSLKNPAADKR